MRRSGRRGDRWPLWRDRHACLWDLCVIVIMVGFAAATIATFSLFLYSAYGGFNRTPPTTTSTTSSSTTVPAPLESASTVTFSGG